VTEWGLLFGGQGGEGCVFVTLNAPSLSPFSPPLSTIHTKRFNGFVAVGVLLAVCSSQGIVSNAFNDKLAVFPASPSIPLALSNGEN